MLTLGGFLGGIIAWLRAHGMDKVGNTITLSLPEFGINHVKAYVTGIKPTTLDTRGINWSKLDLRPVIGKFKRYTLDVRTYTFRDSKGHIDHIHVTPNHPFYVQNKHGFVPIENVKDTDILIGMEGKHTGVRVSGNGIDAHGNNSLDDPIRLVCDKGKHSHCGKPYSNGKNPIAVYNLEIYRQHVFRVGGRGVVVHNCDVLSINNISKFKYKDNYLYIKKDNDIQINYDVVKNMENDMNDYIKNVSDQEISQFSDQTKDPCSFKYIKKAQESLNKGDISNLGMDEISISRKFYKANNNDFFNGINMSKREYEQIFNNIVNSQNSYQAAYQAQIYHYLKAV